MNRPAQARLLYTLLDAAEDEGRLRDSAIVKRWHAVKARFNDAHCEQEHTTLEALIDELDRAGALTGTWIQARWTAAKARGETSSPFPTDPKPRPGARRPG